MPEYIVAHKIVRRYKVIAHTAEEAKDVIRHDPDSIRELLEGREEEYDIEYDHKGDSN